MTCAIINVYDQIYRIFLVDAAGEQQKRIMGRAGRLPLKRLPEKEMAEMTLRKIKKQMSLSTIRKSVNSEKLQTGSQSRCSLQVVTDCHIDSRPRRRNFSSLQ